MDNSAPPAEPIQAQAETESPRASRPFSVTILSLGVLIITVINLVRLILSIRDWEFLSSWPGVSPFYIAVTGLIWTLIGACLLWGLWGRRIWAPRLMQAVTLTYALYYWLDAVFLQGRTGGGTVGAMLLPVNWPFAAGTTVVCLAYTAWTLSRRKVKAYFGQFDIELDHQKTSGDERG